MKFKKILSVRNILRASGVVAITVGAPMLIAPPLMVQVFFGKRDETREADKEALNLTMQALGIALTGSGVKSLETRVSRSGLRAALCMEALFAGYHVCNKICGRTKNAEGRKDTANLFLIANGVVVVLQILSFCFGEKEKEE